MLEALVAKAAMADTLEARTLALEEERFTVARANQIADAKRAGKWTLALEQQGDRLADMAKRLNEDRVKALETHWEAAPVVIAPGGERQGNVSHELSLSDEENEAALAIAKMKGKPVADVRKSMIEEKKLQVAAQ